LNASQNNKLRAYLAVSAVLEKYKTVWQALVGFNKAVVEFDALLPEITDLVRIQSSRSGATTEKGAALEALGNSAFEIAAAVRSFAVENEDHELAGRVDYSLTDIVAGRENAVAARCRDILVAANGVIDSLEDYGIVPAKLTKLKGKIDAYEALLPRPRQSIGASRAATKVLPARFSEADVLLGDRLDGLMPQFKDSAPDFYNEYFAARNIVDNNGGQSAKSTSTPTPAPTH